MIHLLLFLLLFLLSCQKERTIYDITFTDLQRNKVKIQKPQGKNLLLYVWTGTCTGHTEDMKLINEHYGELSKRYKIVSLAVFMTPEDVKEVLKQYKIEPKFTVLTDPQGKITDIVKLVFLPSTMIFDEKGNLLQDYPRLPLRELISFVESHYVSLCENLSVHSAFNLPSR